MSPSPSPVPDSTPSHVDDQEEHTVKERTKSISDQMSGTSVSIQIEMAYIVVRFANRAIVINVKTSVKHLINS